MLLQTADGSSYKQCSGTQLSYIYIYINLKIQSDVQYMNKCTINRTQNEHNIRVVQQNTRLERSFHLPFSAIKTTTT